MTQWRVTPDGERQWRSADGNWYPTESAALLAGLRPSVEGPPTRSIPPARAATPGVYAKPVGRNRYGPKDAKVAILVTWVIIAVIVAIVLIANATRASPSAADGSYISGHRYDFHVITSGVANIETEIGLNASGTASGSIDQLASLAQQTHGLFDRAHSDLVSSDSASGPVEVWTASGELRDAMANLVTYTGNPTPATLARFTTLFDQGVADWNQGVSDLWSSAKEANPPTIQAG
jgi:hypothetical protein